MAESRFQGIEQVAEDASTPWASLAEDDESFSVDWYRRQHKWLYNRVEELDRQLRRRTIVLAGTLVLSALLGSFTVTSFYKSERPTVVLAAALSSDAPHSLPPLTKIQQRSQLELSQGWIKGEEQIEAIAALYFDAQNPQAPTEQLATTWQGDGGSEAFKAEAVARWKICGEGSAAFARDWAPMLPETVVSASFKEDQSRAVPANGLSHYAAKDFVNLRAAPDNSAEVLTVVAQGALVQRTGSNLGWLQVEYSVRSASSVRGWVYGSYLSAVETAGELARP